MIRVMMIEDEEEIAHFHAIFLKKIPGFSLVASARTFDEGLVSWRSISQICCCLMYIASKAGLIFKQLRMDERNIDVILITSANDSYTVQTGYRFGVVDYLVKPFTFARFKEAMERYRSMSDEAQPDLLLQNEIDTFLQRNEKIRSKERIELPKGITKVTAIRILQALELTSTSWRTTAELEEQTSISHVSLRKYMRFFEEELFIQKDLVYLSHGRPFHQYKISEQGRQFLKENDFV
ncbi:LOW QUALITY PROTEIN: two-component response regulator [Bacillus sp. JCM 19046]|nr:LOW QUALITY PROTEIN: two-component response regulator [Bacillus sp. JCM 19046]